MKFGTELSVLAATTGTEKPPDDENPFTLKRILICVLVGIMLAATIIVYLR